MWTCSEKRGGPTLSHFTEGSTLVAPLCSLGGAVGDPGPRGVPASPVVSPREPLTPAQSWLPPLVGGQDMRCTGEKACLRCLLFFVIPPLYLQDVGMVVEYLGGGA